MVLASTRIVRLILSFVAMLVLMGMFSVSCNQGGEVVEVSVPAKPHLHAEDEAPKSPSTAAGSASPSPTPSAQAKPENPPASDHNDDGHSH